MRVYSPGDQPVQDYFLEAHLGSGAYGEVWRALGPGQTPCALKIIRDLRGRGGGKEFRALKLLRTLRHIHLVTIQGFWVRDSLGKAKTGSDLSPGSDLMTQGPDVSRTERAVSETQKLQVEKEGGAVEGAVAEELIIAMSLCDTSLEAILRQHPHGLPLSDLVRFLSGAAEAIDYVNGHGIQHCDIKPANVLLLGEHAQVADFGIAQEIGENLSATVAACTPAYADPVVLEGHDPVDTTDLYCLATTYIELRTGRFPYRTTGKAMRRSSVLNAKRKLDFDFTGIPGPEQAVLLKALAADPDERLFRGARKAQDFMEEIRHATGVAGSDRIKLQIKRPDRRHYQAGDEPVTGYVLQEKMGAGSFGEVWRATGPGNLSCAVKIISDLRRRGGSKEFKSLKLLRDVRHVHLVDIHGFWTKDAVGPAGEVTDDESSAGRACDRHDALRTEPGGSA